MLGWTEITSQTYSACGIQLTVDHFIASLWHLVDSNFFYVACISITMAIDQQDEETIYSQPASPPGAYACFEMGRWARSMIWENYVE